MCINKSQEGEEKMTLHPITEKKGSVTEFMKKKLSIGKVIIMLIIAWASGYVWKSLAYT